MQSSAWGPAHPHYGVALDDLFDENPGADFTFWDRIAYWTVDEATALSFGFDPNLANWGELLSCDHPFTKLYENRRALALRAMEMGQLPQLAAPMDTFLGRRRLESNSTRTLRRRSGRDTK